jgi:hypothetical protein
MKPWIKGLVVAAVQVSLVASLGLKLLYDRATRPRVWVLTAPYDPNLPIRGRYIRLQLVVEPRNIQEKQPGSLWEPGTAVILRVEGDNLVAERDPHEFRYDPADLHLHFIGPAESKRTLLDKPVAFFIPEHLPDPSRRQPGQELWVEVTVPSKGAPRPIRLGVKHGNGPIIPLQIE